MTIITAYELGQASGYPQLKALRKTEILYDIIITEKMAKT